MRLSRTSAEARTLESVAPGSGWTGTLSSLTPSSHYAFVMTQLPQHTSAPTSVDVLVLGAGWTSTFLLPLCSQRGISTAATARSPPPDSDLIPFAFDPSSDDGAPFQRLPDAQTVLITFPIKDTGASAKLVRLYQATRRQENGGETLFIQLGSTSVWPVRLVCSPLFPIAHLDFLI
jgi:hypothetical protein